MKQTKSIFQRVICRCGCVALAGALTLLANIPFVQAQTVLNVTDFGAVGDAVQFWVNTTSNSVLVTTTNQLSNAAIGDAIEVFQAGAQTYGTNSFGTNAYANQDLVATITNIVDGTNIYMSIVSSNTLTNTFATYGHNNQTNFQNAIAAASGTNTIINIPGGTYLILATTHPGAYWFAGIILSNGGVTFNGAGTNLTTLLSKGAWALQTYAGISNWPTRGELFEEVTPIGNDYPVILQNMTLDGGVQIGNIASANGSIRGIYANPVDGMQWDTTHDAFLVWGNSHNGAINNMLWTNLVFQHWRGEMVKSIDGSTNGNLNIFNCVFNDGEATAINIYPSLNVSNCVFENLFQIAEYYQAYSTNTSYFQSNFVTNIAGNGFAINGGKGSNPAFIFQGNTFYLAGGNGIETMPGDNIVITSNQFFNVGYSITVVLGAAGYQGTYCNSNIVIACNNFITPYIMLEIGGGISATDQQRVENVSIYSNTITGTFSSDWSVALQTWGWTTNIHFYDNDFSTQSAAKIAFTSGAAGGQLALVDTNNLYYSSIYDLVGITNYISYATGSRYEVIYPFHAGTVYALTDTNASQIPPGAQILVLNSNMSAAPIPIYLNSALTRGPLTVPSGGSVAFQWTNSFWQLLPSLQAPYDLQITSP